MNEKLSEWLKDEIVEVELLQLDIAKCEHCERVEPTIEMPSRRMDCNKSWTLCTSCAEEYDEYWNDMWADYYSSRL
jgi:hypothetical protein